MVLDDGENILHTPPVRSRGESTVPVLRTEGKASILLPPPHFYFPIFYWKH